MDGQVWLGEFVVWSPPMLHPWDMQLWVAKELPPAAIYVPNNVLIAARLGRRVSGRPTTMVIDSFFR